MGRERTLLERIAEAGNRGSRGFEPSAAEDVDALMESVGRQLVRVLNSRHSLSEAMPDYGLPALTDLTIGSGDYVHRVREAIRVAVEKFEPRLRRVRVTRVEEEDAPHTLLFRVDATLVTQSGEHRVFYETAVSGDGRYDVSS